KGLRSSGRKLHKTGADLAIWFISHRMDTLVPVRRAYSSGGKSASLITMRSVVRVHLDPPFEHTSNEVRGISSIGIASALQAEGQDFDSPMLHSTHPRSHGLGFLCVCGNDGGVRVATPPDPSA